MAGPSSSKPPLIEFDKVVRAYGDGETIVRALAGVSFTIHSGEFVAVMGSSGSGKSTTMNILGCLDLPTLGSYRFRGAAVEKLTRRQRALLRRHFIGFVFQDFNLLKRTTALANVELPLVYRGMAVGERRRRAREALALVGLSDREKHKSSQLSGGQQQRVAIARTLAMQPNLMLADEPTGNLDSERSHDVMSLLKRINRERGMTIVLVTHEPEIAAYADRILTFRDGRLIDDSVSAALEQGGAA